MYKKLITRCDDFGSARAADRAILQALEQGDFVKNVSCMAAAPHIDTDAAELEALRKKKGFCIGLHGTLNAEWDYLKFLPVLPRKEIPSLIGEHGTFPMHPMEFRQKMPEIQEAVAEISAQLDALTRLGLTVEYLDTHMLPDAVVPGLKEALSGLAEKKGLIDQRWFYHFPKERQPSFEGAETAEEARQAYQSWFQSLLPGEQYICILHPAYYSRETLLFQNSFLSGDQVARSRSREADLLLSDTLKKLCGEMEIRSLTYREAEKQGDTTEIAARMF